MKDQNTYFYNPILAGFVSFFVGTLLAGISTYMNGAGFIESRIPVLMCFIVTFTWPINVHAFHDAWRIEVDKNYVNHTFRFFAKLGIFTLYAAFIHVVAERRVEAITLIRILFAIVLMQAWFWLLFDLLINYHRGKPMLYIGKTAAIDKFFNKMSNATMLMVKLFTFIIAFYCYYRVIQ